jgi:hypothetical protein
MDRAVRRYDLHFRTLDMRLIKQNLRLRNVTPRGAAAATIQSIVRLTGIG